MNKRDSAARKQVRNQLQLIEAARWASRKAGEELLAILLEPLYYGGDLSISDTSLVISAFGYNDLLRGSAIAPAVIQRTLREAEKCLQQFVDPNARAKGYALRLVPKGEARYQLGVHRSDHTPGWQ